jgi:transcriptional regulator GlxA family with amidase domain
VAPALEKLVDAQGVARIELFMTILAALCRATSVRTLASSSYLPDPSGYMSAGINKVLAHIGSHLTEPMNEADFARLAGQSQSAFSRSFRRHTGMTFVQYVNRLRVNLACQHLMSDTRMPITEVCFAAGFNNLSNFNRQFLAQKGMPPSRFRSLLIENSRATAA